MDELDFARVSQFMSIGQEIWKAVIYIKFNGCPPKDQLKMFQEDFS